VSDIDTAVADSLKVLLLRIMGASNGATPLAPVEEPSQHQQRTYRARPIVLFNLVQKDQQLGS
jgi:hypothetical protein